MKISELAVGESASITRMVTDSDVNKFAEVTGDYNLIHMDEEWAAATPQKGRIVHGMLLASFISAVIAMKLPGAGTIIQGQELRFMLPARIGDEITATVRVREVLTEYNTAILAISCTNQEGRKLVTGIATVLPPTESQN
ncbi:(R)-specific enoyl-CoA hydratase [bioreactor metagenome]|uniref:(R)-specific enoyl-CoA hydratase n=1 Tax=bioreactor metagenome TaxID=1076179 RepID=A0A644W248_9ZZZZ